MMRNIIKYIVVFLLLIVIFISTLMFVSVLFNRRLDYNVQYSAQYLTNEANRPRFFTYNGNSILDNYTDATMMNIASNLDTKAPLKSALSGALYIKSGEDGINSLIESTKEPRSAPNKTYSRYWHGYLVFLKPLLMFFNYMEIRLFNSYIFYGLLVACLFMLYKKVDWLLPVMVLFATLMLNMTIIPMSLQFTCVFLIAFVATLVLLPLYIRKPTWMPISFFILGAVTMFFDFYTYPILSFGLPMVSILVYKHKVESSTMKEMTKLFALCLLTWFLCYVFIWIAKILLAGLVLGGQEIETAVHQFLFRVDRHVPSIGHELLWYKSIKLCFDEVFIRPVSVFLTIGAVLWVPIFIFFKKPWKSLKLVPVLLLVGLVPLIWFAIAVNPISIHSWFQHRAIGLTILCVLYSMVYSIDIQRIKACLSRIKWRKSNRIDGEHETKAV